MSQRPAPNVPLPKHWKKHVKSAILHVISLAQYATAYTRSWAADSRNARVRLTAEKDRLEQELALLREEIRIKDARMALGRTIHSAGRAPKYLICDKGPQFWCPGFKSWCKRRKIKPRFGAIGQHGSIAVIERFILTMKMHCTRVILVPVRREKIRDELPRFASWYNGHRPHMTLKGSTPDEVYQGRHPTCRYPRFEPRPNWPARSPCARPGVPIRGRPGQRFELNVEFEAVRKHLPNVTLRRAA